MIVPETVYIVAWNATAFINAGSRRVDDCESFHEECDARDEFNYRKDVKGLSGVLYAFKYTHGMIMIDSFGMDDITTVEIALCDLNASLFCHHINKSYSLLANSLYVPISKGENYSPERLG